MLFNIYPTLVGVKNLESIPYPFDGYILLFVVSMSKHRFCDKSTVATLSQFTNRFSHLLLCDIKPNKALLAALTNPGPDVVFVMSPQNAMFASTVLQPGFAYTILTSSALTAGQVVAVDCAGVAAAISAEPQILVSESAAIHEEDTTPLPLATGAQGSGVLASPMRAAFQTDVALMRVIMHCAWAARAGAVATISSVSW